MFHLTHRLLTRTTAGAVVLALTASPLAAGTLSVKAGQSIQAAIDNAQGGDTIAISSGTYYETLLVPKQLVGLSIVGKGAVILDGRPDPDNGSGTGLTIRAFDVSVKNLIIRHTQGGDGGDGHDSSGAGVYVGNQGVRLERVTVIGAQDDGIRIGGADATLRSCRVLGSWGSAVSIEGARATVDKLEVLGVDGWGLVASSDDLVLSNSTLRSRYGVSLYGERMRLERNSIVNAEVGVDAYGDDMRVERNTLRGIREHGLNIGGEDAVIVRNTLSDCGEVGILAEHRARIDDNRIDDVEYGILGYGALSISGNTISNARRIGIEAASLDMAEISGNRLTACGQLGSWALSVQGQDATIAANQVRGALGESLRVRSGSQDLTVEKNRLSDGFSNGLVVESNCSQTRLLGNQVRNHMGEGIQNRGETTTLEQNSSLGNRTPLTNGGSLVDLGGNKLGKGAPAPSSAPEPEISFGS